MYINILKHGWVAKVERMKDGVYGIGLYLDHGGDWSSGTKPWEQRRFFYLYPRNPYVNRFIDE